MTPASLAQDNLQFPNSASPRSRQASGRRRERPELEEALNPPSTATRAGSPVGDPGKGITLMAVPLLMTNTSAPLGFYFLPTLSSISCPCCVRPTPPLMQLFPTLITVVSMKVFAMTELMMLCAWRAEPRAEGL